MNKELFDKISRTLKSHYEKRDLKNIMIKPASSEPDIVHVYGSYPFSDERVDITYRYDSTSKKLQYLEKNVVSLDEQTMDLAQNKPKLPAPTRDPKTGRPADEYTVKPPPPTPPPVNMPTVPEPGWGIRKVTEGDSCPHCGGELVSEELMNEKQDACYHKVKSRYKVWPSAYASGALVQCRKKGAKNWGKKS
jgi:hypothetical protein